MNIVYIWRDRRYLLSREREKLLIKFVWHLPRELVMWCYIRVAAHATTGKHANTVVPELRMMDALKRWDDRDGRGEDPGPGGV
jgi:hypothetical protein